MAVIPISLVNIELSSGHANCSLEGNHFGTCRYPFDQTQKLRKGAVMEYFGFIYLSIVSVSVYY